MNQIAEERKRIGVTQADLANKLHWSQSRIGNYESGARTPGASKRAIASYYFETAKPRKMSTRGGDRMKKPSFGTCRNEIDQILEATVWLLYQPMQKAFISRKRVAKIKKVA
ncbi:TPA: helix-turn-helix transcriptional regulator [Yersinia enterocolitica]|nr:helix-turn-helix transcriptional regulator [Yersinia enterocolitica]